MPGRTKQLVLLLACSMSMMGVAQSVPAQAPAAAPGPATPGDAAFAQGRLEEAEAAYDKTIAGDPASAGALGGLARIRLYEGRDKEAAELARKALAAAPDNQLAKATLQMAEIRQARFGPDRYQFDPPSTVVELPFVITDPLPVVRVRIGGKDRNFLLDTGAPDIMLRRELATELGLQTTPAGEGVFAGGRRAPVERTMVPEIELGGIVLRNVPGAVMPLGGGMRLPGVEIDGGVMGTGVLVHFLSTIDYCSGRLLLAPRSQSAAFEQRAAASGANVVPMWLVGDHFIFARAHMNHAPEALFHVDTGLAGGGLTANKAALDAAGITIDESQAFTGVGGGGAVRVVPFTADATLGTLTRQGVRGIHSLDGDPSSVFPFKTGGVISHGFFRQSRLTFDFDAMRLVTEDCPAGS